MGNCCSGNSNEQEVNIQGRTGGAMSGVKGTEYIFDGREVCGMTGADKMALVIRIQALIRGSIARKRVKKIYGYQMTPGLVGTGGEPNYANSTVMEIKRQLGPFVYDAPATEEGSKRKKRPLTTLENGARYEGEWNETTGKREGKGYQIWADGSLYEGQW